MKTKILVTLLASFAILLSFTGLTFAAKPTSLDSEGLETAWVPSACTQIQDGVLVYLPGRYLEGELLETGFDMYGYNYQSHLFKGSYANVYLNADGFPPYEGYDAAYAQRLTDEGFVTDPYATWYWPYREYELQMKWNDAWLANTDCDDDGLLDRHYGFASYVGSGAWQTNQYNGTNGFASLTKISAVPADANLDGGLWYTADGIEIGSTIWGEFAITQDVLSGEGTLYVSPNGPGYGQY